MYWNRSRARALRTSKIAPFILVLAILGPVILVLAILVTAGWSAVTFAETLEQQTDDPAQAFEQRGRLQDPREIHLYDVVQLSFGGENAEAYWSPDGSELIFQSTRPPYECDQIFRIPADGSGEAQRVSTGHGRTTCAYFSYPKGERIYFSSTHEASAACPPPPDRSQGYVWPIYSGYEIYSARLDGSDLVALTNNDAYDAEATLCHKDGSILFTSDRDGDLDLYRMDADGGNVKRLTDAPGYDGGAFYSADCSQIVWRASRPKQGEELEDYRRLLAQDLVRPSKMEIWVANADGSNARQLTYFEAGSFAPYFFPSGKRIIFSSNFGSGNPREFDLWAINVNGTELERITWAPGFDGFPMFSPDGSRLAFGSNRNQGKPGETDVYVARWRDIPPRSEEAAEDRYLRDVAHLASDELEGRGIGTLGLEKSAQWLAERFRTLRLTPAGTTEAYGGYWQSFKVPVKVERGIDTHMSLDGTPVDRKLYMPLSFSAEAEAAGDLVFAGYGVTAPDLGVDDYAGIDAKGKVVLVRRFLPETDAYPDESVKRRYSDLRYKAFNAREHGAVALLVVDLPALGEGEEMPEEADLPELSVDTKGDAGIPVVAIRREVGKGLLEGRHEAQVKIELDVFQRNAHNVVGRIEAQGAGKLPGAVVIGAHYDHLGLGGTSSLAPDAKEPHNGADDNASGTAALLEIARYFSEHRDELLRDVYVVAFSAEESGVLGSTHFVRHPPEGLAIDDVVAMLNMDMVGRLRDNTVAVLGAESGEEWPQLVPPLCDQLGLVCNLSGDGYGPSDQTPFYAAGVPVLHFFTGAHDDYHKPSDDTWAINAAGGVRIAKLVTEVAEAVAARPERLTLKRVPAPEPRGDSRNPGAYLGTVPEYTGDEEGRPGVPLAGARPGSPAEEAGFQRGDLLVELGGREIRDIHDFVFVLRSARPGDVTTAVVLRGGERVELKVTYGQRGQTRPGGP